MKRKSASQRRSSQSSAIHQKFIIEKATYWNMGSQKPKALLESYFTLTSIVIPKH
jgi:hypothetical protein